MHFKLRGIDFHLSFWFFAVVACFALLDKGALLFYFVLPIAVHELGHLLVMAALGVGVQSVSCTIMGVDIRRDTRALSYGREIAVCLGGVAVNLLLAAVLYLCVFQSMRVMLLVAANIAVAIFNLAPIGDLDGGQIVRLTCERFFSPDTARVISKGSSVLVLACLFGLAIFLVLIRWFNPTLLIACGYLAVNVLLND